MENIETLIQNHKIGDEIEWKFGLITRTVYRKNVNIFEIDEICGQWIKAIITKKQLIDLYSGKLSLLELNWK
jgi:hypothetical protein